MNVWIIEFLEMLFPLDVKKVDIEGAFLHKYKNLPSSIFKYRSVTKNSLLNLEQGRVWLADPRSLNDPYDCSHSVDFQRMSEKLLPTVPPQTVENLTSEEFPDKDQENIKDALKKLRNDLWDEMCGSNSEKLKGCLSSALFQSVLTQL
ncbi:MAG: hypothetical protein PHG00_15290 [Methylococcales bacterium]|nr:hypothetical protein [Methylococcales bacterium]